MIRWVNNVSLDCSIIGWAKVFFFGPLLFIPPFFHVDERTVNHAVCANGLLSPGRSTNVKFKVKVPQSTIKSVQYSPCMVCKQLYPLPDSGRGMCSSKRINLCAFNQCAHIGGVGAVSFGVVHIGYATSLGWTWTPDWCSTSSAINFLPCNQAGVSGDPLIISTSLLCDQPLQHPPAHLQSNITQAETAAHRRMTLFLTVTFENT